MKKKLLAIVFLCLTIFLITSCDIIMDGSTDATDTEETAEDTTEVILEQTTDSPDSFVSETKEATTAEEPTEDTTDQSSEETTATTEALTEGSTEEPTEEITTCDHEYPQDVVDSLVAEGKDMEQVVFERGPDIELQYTFIVNKRVLRHGEQLEVTIWNLISACDFIDLQKHYEMFQEWGVSPLMLFAPDGEIIYIDYTYTVLGPHFALTIPEDLEPGTYHLLMDLMNENCIDECCIVIY